MGGKAKLLKDIVGKDKTIESVLWYQSINHINKDEGGKEINAKTVAGSKNRTTKRLKNMSYDILKQIEGKEGENT